MGFAPNDHLPLAAVHAHAIARHNPGSDADLALAAYCPPGGSASPAPFHSGYSIASMPWPKWWVHCIRNFAEFIASVPDDTSASKGFVAETGSA